MTGGIQERRDSGLEGFRTGGIQEMKDSGRQVHRKLGILERTDSGLKGYRKGGIQDSRRTGKEVILYLRKLTFRQPLNHKQTSTQKNAPNCLCKGSVKTFLNGKEAPIGPDSYDVIGTE